MKRVALFVVVAALVNTSALAGTVSFAPATQTVDPGADMRVFFDVFIESVETTEFQGQFTAIDLPMGSNESAAGAADNLNILVAEWTYSAQIIGDSAGGFLLGTPASAGAFTSDIKVGGALTGAQSPVYHVGTLAVDAAGLAPGVYEIDVLPGTGASELSNNVLPGAREPLTGSTSVRVTPEPATLMLLGLGGIIALRRRRAAA